MLCVSLVHHVATTLGMILNRKRCDWHTADAYEDLPEATSGISSPGTHTTHGVILGLKPGISVGPSRGLDIDRLETQTPHQSQKSFSGLTRDPFCLATPAEKDARVKPEHDSVGVALSQYTSLSFRTRTACEPEPRGDTHICHNALAFARVCNDQDLR